MGLFLALSGVIDANANDVQGALSDFARNHSGGFELAEETTNTPNIGIITHGMPNITVLYPDGFFEWDDASQHISEMLEKPVFSFHIHDGDLWMFVLFLNGREIGWFNPVPDYWEELSPEAKAQWQGDASLIGDAVPGVSPQAIAKYFVEWDLENENPEKAYPDDAFTICDCWQMCDFMRKIGLEYPMGDDGSIHGETFRLWTKHFPFRTSARGSSQRDPKKPWWKFW